MFTAIIIEPRQHKALKFVIHNFLENLSDEWGMVIFHGSRNKEYVSCILHELTPSYRSRINLVNLHISNLNSESYSKLFVTPAFYNFIPTETFLVFQTDTMILSQNKHGIDSFLEYDYVGAPWKNYHVGNGGLSLRKKSKMLEIIKKKPYTNNQEDEYFSLKLPSTLSYHVPTFDMAKQFSVETIFYDKPFGIHNCWKYLSPSDMTMLIHIYPEITTLIELQS